MQSENSDINDLIAQLKKLEMPYAEGAWEDFGHFREQEEGKKRRVLFYYRMAASLIILLGFGLLTIFLNPSDKLKKVNDVSESVLPKDFNNKLKNQYSRNEIQFKNEPSIKEENDNLVLKETLPIKERKTVIPNPKVKARDNDFVQLTNPSNSRYGNSNSINSSIGNDNYESINKPKNGNINNSKSKSYDKNIIQNENVKTIELLSKKPLKLLKTNLLKTLIINPLNAEIFTKLDNVDKKKLVPKNQQLSVALIPQMNQMNRVSSPVNLGIGGFYKVDLSRKIAFVTGIQVGKQTINQQFELPVFTITTAGSFQPKSSITDWWSIEIPAQISWKLPYKINQAEVSILTGVSLSGTTQKLTESTFENTRTIITKVTNFATGQVQEIFETKTEEITQQNTQNKQNFNTGILLNFSINFSYPLGKNWLSIEPYIKNPITNMAGEEFRYLNSGVILKWNFGKK